MFKGMGQATALSAGLALVAALALAPAAGAQDGPTLSLSFDNLAPLDESMELYEGWAIVDGMPVSTGVFNVNESGEPVAPGTGDVIEEFLPASDITGATDIKISIEPVPDGDPAPSGLIILGGMLSGDMAELMTGLEGVAAAEGCFILATPSDNDIDDTNDNQGIWWLQMPGPVAGLTGLPDLGEHWTYEGWVVDVSGGMPVPYSTGTFSMAEGFDSDMAGPMGGGPPFPGQDFVEFQGGPVLDLASGDFAAVISIEPVPDDSPAPFQLKPLAGAIMQGAMDGCVTNQTTSTFPSGSAMLMGSVAVEESSWSSVKSLFE
jgi:hypothetical protein